jgi:hypothetical protein
LGVAGAGAANVAVPVDDLRPRAKDLQITLDAVDDIRFCEMLFDKWMTEFDNVTSDSNKPHERVQTLRFYLWRLKEQAGLCSNTTNEILGRHILFASLMARRIDDASKSQYNLKYGGSETTKVAKDINRASRLLSTNVTQMTNVLNLFVSALEDVQVAMKIERSLAEHILRWLESLFKTIADIIATSAFPVSALREAAPKFCTPGPEPREGKESESLDSVIIFLKEIVPNEAQNAQKILERFDEALYIKGLESRMRAGQRVTLHGPDPAAVAKEWRDVAEKYQSAFERKRLYS